MAYKNFENFEGANGETQQDTTFLTFENTGNNIELPNESFIKDADITRDGSDLVLHGPDGTIAIEGYFSGLETPTLTAPDGSSLTPQLVDSFVTSGNEYAQNMMMNDVSPIGMVDEINGDATITRADGTDEPLTIGTPVYQGDVVNTSDNGAINITFVDDSSFAVSEDTRLAIDEYVFDPATEEGTQSFSVLKGVFVYTSGLIGREDPDDVNIDTPVGSIGIRGTIIAGDVNEGEITVVEGAIVLRTPSGMEMTLASQFETGRFGASDGTIENLGQKSADEMLSKFSNVAQVAPSLFSSINDAAAEQDNNQDAGAEDSNGEETTDEPQDEQQDFDADGATDQDGDNQVDGTVDEGKTESQDAGEPESQETNESQETSKESLNQADDNTPQQITVQSYAEDNPVETVTYEAADDIKTIASNELKAAVEAKMAAAALNNANIYVDNDDQKGTKNNNGKNPNQDNTSSQEGANELAHLTNAEDGNPDNHSIAPDVFFQSAEDYTWSYDFSNDFTGEDITFELTESTINTLQNQFSLGTINNWDFTEEGVLTIEISEDVSDTATIGSPSSTHFDIIATDGDGNTLEVNGEYLFTLYDEDQSIGINITNTVNNNLYEDGDGNIYLNKSNTVIGSEDNLDTNVVEVGSENDVSNTKVFLGDGDDSIDFSYTDHEVTDNVFNLGSGNNSVDTTASDSNALIVGNTFIGGDDDDSFVLSAMENKFYGMDGNDTFSINIEDINPLSIINALYNGSEENVLVDGGTQEEDSYGDTFAIEGNSASVGGVLYLDFEAIDDAFIKGIERLDLDGSNMHANIVLSYDDIIAMTDENNTLIIRANSGDTLNFIDENGNFNNFEKIANNQKIDDNVIATEDVSDDTYFDTYSDGTVTLIIEDTPGSQATINGL